MNLQVELSNELILIQPLKEKDFERLYAVASDPLIWEQHPNNDRYKLDVFKTFFDKAIESNGAFLVFDNKTGELIGSSRYYDFNENDSSVAIGFTFIKRSHWGGPYNKALKQLMINYAFESVDKIFFHVGNTNFRSQKAVEKLGAIKIDDIDTSRFTYLLKPDKISI